MKSFQMRENIKGFEFGTPIDTEIIYGDKTYGFEELPMVLKFEDSNTYLKFLLGQDDRVYGLGPNMGGINKRGRRYEAYCTDDPLHHEDKVVLYGAHNFFMIQDNQGVKGYFIDFPSRIYYDVGFSDRDAFSIHIHGKDFTFYIIEGDTLNEIVTKFHKMIKKPYLPPKWGLGYFQSRWGYKSEEEIREIHETFKGKDLPLEGIYLDLDYMEDFKDFSISKERFPNFKQLVEDLKEEGVRLVPIIDAGVKIEKGYSVYDQGIEGGHFALNADGKPYVAAVWPGKVHFPDFLQEKTRVWFGDYYKVLTDLGIEGIWNDMNEPAIFYDEDSLDEAVTLAIKAKGKNLDVFDFFDLKDKFQNMGNKDVYYQRFFHRLHGKSYSNEDLHNQYGYMMTKSASEGLRKHLGKRSLLISRASSIGMHAYGGIWTGDNSSWWSHIELNLKMLPTLNMSGFYYVGADTGGFGGNCSGELLCRWMQLSVFTPLLRNHAALGTKPQEPYAFGEEVTGINRKLLKDRYRLIPYLYSQLLMHHRLGGLMFTPLSFEFTGREALDAEDQLLVGEEIMIAPLYKPNAQGRYVYLPEEMVLVNFKEKPEMMVLKEGVRYMAYALNELKFFLRKNKLMVYGEESLNVKTMRQDQLNVLGYVDTKANFTLWNDDGDSFAYEEGKVFKTKIMVEKLASGHYDISVNSQDEYLKIIKVMLIDSDNNIFEKEVEVSNLK